MVKQEKFTFHRYLRILSLLGESLKTCELKNNICKEVHIYLNREMVELEEAEYCCFDDDNID